VASDDPAVTVALATGARRAFAEARAASGPALELLVGERESHWASAAAAAVRMAMDEGAVAVIAPPERRRAHEIAQFGTRAGVPVISTSSAASVTQAGSTWVVSVAESGAEGAARGDWESVGYDAGRAVVEAVRRNGLRRRGLTAALAGARPFAGADGPIAIAANGARRSP
jgi:ABC-type branched-subunit amino acid transport system substrate-binding protein